jgi:chromate transporter
MQTKQPRPALRDILVAFFSAGIQSFGGGSSTFLIVNQACVKRGWMDDAEFGRAWALVQLSPGINLVKLAALIGHRLRGWGGLGAAMAGLLVPSATVTVLMTAGYWAIRQQPAVQSALRGVLPAAIGLSLAMAVQMALPPLKRARREGAFRLSLHLLVLAGAAGLMVAAFTSPIAIMLVAGLATSLLALPIGGVLGTLPRKTLPKEKGEPWTS